MKAVRPWSKAFADWEDQAKDNLGYSRAAVWNDTTGKMYFANGNRISVARAMTACKKESDTSCKLIVQDDRIVDGSEYAQTLSKQLLSSSDPKSNYAAANTQR